MLCILAFEDLNSFILCELLSYIEEFLKSLYSSMVLISISKILENWYVLP
jgi:hypothetical protein